MLQGYPRSRRDGGKICDMWSGKLLIDRIHIYTSMEKHKDADWLREKYIEEDMTANEVADEADRAAATIRTQLGRHGIRPRRRCGDVGKPFFFAA